MSILLDLEERIVNILILEKHNDVEREKIVFGVRLILNDLWKIMIVYLIALCLDVFLATLLTHLVFFTLRQVCFGFHFQNSIICLVASIFSLPIGVFLIKSLGFENNSTFFTAILATLVLVVFAPIGTEKRPVFGQKHRSYLRKKLFVRLFILWVIILMVNGDIQSFFLYAIILLAISILTQKFIGGK